MKKANNDAYNIFEQYKKKCHVIGEIVTITTDLAQAATSRTSPFPPAPGISKKPSDQNFNSNIISSGKSKEELQKDVNNFSKLIELTKGSEISDEIKNKVEQAKHLLVQYSALYGLKPNHS